MRLPEIKPRRYRDDSTAMPDVELSNDAEADLDYDSWDLFSCWKEQQGDRIGGGNDAPAIPHSQRAYDGDNHFDYCEVLVLR